MKQNNGPDLLLHEFFHTIERMVGIWPQHGYYEENRHHFPKWHGTNGNDYYFWQLSKEIPAFFKKIHRVLKKDGKFYLVDYQRQNTKIRRFFFRIYLLLTSPSHVKDFLKYDWEAIMKECGFHIEKIESYRVSQIICSSR